MSAVPGLPLRLDFPAEALDHLAALVEPLVAARLASEPDRNGGWLNAARAAEYLSLPKRRIYDLKSAGALEPDGYDGRTPLWRRETLDAYVTSRRP